MYSLDYVLLISHAIFSAGGSPDKVWLSLENAPDVNCQEGSCDGQGLVWGDPGNTPVVYLNPTTLDIAQGKLCTFLDFDTGDVTLSQIKGEACDNTSQRVMCEITCQ